MPDSKASARHPNVRRTGMLIGLALSALLAAAGYLWAPPADWSPSQAEELNSAWQELHDATNQSHTGDAGHAEEHAGDALAARDPKFAAARKRYDELNAQLNAAIEGPARRQKVLLRTGLAGAVLFGIGYLANRRAT
ncbi:MAG: hypothetical protein KDA61_17405 [Planctomycetales bacterium]|nr:hypothetical protein [Planctomycetales bacterium]